MSRQHIGRPARALLLAILVPASVGAVTVTTWRNSDNPLDVNADGQVTAQDALVLVQEVNANGSHALTGTSPPPFLDVDGDGWVSTADVALVVDHLNAAAPDVSAAGPAGTVGSPGMDVAPGDDQLVGGPSGGTDSVSAVGPAADIGRSFTFQVPLALDRLHTDVQAVGVECYVSSNPVDLPPDGRFTGITSLYAVEGVIGVGNSAPIPVPAGSFSGTATVVFEVLPGVNVLEATHYGCGLLLYGADGRMGDLEEPYTTVTDPEHPNHDAWQPAPGTTFVVAVSGEL